MEILEFLSAIIVAVVTGGLSLLGVVLTVRSNSRTTMAAMQNELKTAQAVTDAKLEALTREVREHNNFARRMPVLEEKVAALEKGMDHLDEKRFAG